MNKLYVVGIGPGSYEDMTMRAVKALSESDVIIGYTVYTELVREHFPEKEYLSTPMTREIERCHMALSKAASGNTVSMVCSGDAGVYGMAGLILGMRNSEEQTGAGHIEVEVIPGVTAALSGAAVLGAPLIHDFAVISLSDRLTPWDTIEKRIACAAQGDFGICFYNPSSRTRKDYLKRACQVIEAYRLPDTVCGYVVNIGREGEHFRICSLRELKEAQTDMFTTVFIGNSMTREQNGRMITPRGYADE